MAQAPERKEPGIERTPPKAGMPPPSPGSPQRPQGAAGERPTTGAYQERPTSEPTPMGRSPEAGRYPERVGEERGPSTMERKEPMTGRETPTGPRMREVSTEDVRGRTVIDTRGTTLGNVSDLVFDPEQWRIRGVLVDLRNEVADDLHMERGAFGKAQLSVSPERISVVGENVILNVDTDDIAGMLRRSGGEY